MSVAFRLKNGSLMLSTEAPGGIYNSSQLKAIASLCEEDSAIVKVTEDQRLALFVDEDRAAEIATKLKKMGLGIRHYRDGLHQPISCIGALCPDHKQDAQGSAMAVTEALASIQLENSLRIGINGCSTCCVPCHTLDVSVMGDDSGYRVSIGGKTTQIAEMAQYLAEGVPAKELPNMLKKVVGIYKESAHANESLQDLLDRVGPSKFISALAPYSLDAATGDAQSFQTNDDEFAAAKSDDTDLGTDDIDFVDGDMGLVDEDMGLVDEDMGLVDGDIDLVDDLDGAAEGTEIPLIADEDGGLGPVDIEDEESSLLGVSMDNDFEDLRASDEMPDDFGDDLDISPAEFSSLDRDMGAEVRIGAADSDLEMLDDDFASGDLNSTEIDVLDDDLSILSTDTDLDGMDSTSLDWLGELVEDEFEDLESSPIQPLVASADVDSDEFDTDLAENFENEDFNLAGIEEAELMDIESIGRGAEFRVAPETIVLSAISKVPQSLDGNHRTPNLSNTEKVAVLPDDLGEMDADEGSEEDESAFEQKFDEDMLDTESYAVTDNENSGDRIEAIRLVEDADLQMDTAMDSADHEEEMSMHSDEDLGFDESLDEAPAAIVKAMPVAKVLGKGMGWLLTGIRDDGAGIVLEFNSGAQVHVDPSVVQSTGERVISVGGQNLYLKRDGNGISIETDGIKFVLPKQVA
jgi:hypothetical protein